MDTGNGTGSEGNDRGRTLRTWCLDVALAYVVGLMIGAPAGLAATWITRSKLALTAVIVLAMVVALVARRTRRRSYRAG
jgi:membrane protein YdbS with pleckstrin-like domain